MASDKKDPKQITVQIHGGDDPEIEKKVDSYMDPSQTSPRETAPDLSLSNFKTKKNGTSLPDLSKPVSKPAPDIKTPDSSAIAPKEFTAKGKEAAGNSRDITEDTETDKVVEDIVVHESDELLQHRDEKLRARNTPKRKDTRSFKVKFIDFVHKWWANKLARYLTFVGLFLILVTLLTVPITRYAILNAFFVRTGASVVVLDNTNTQPLKNVTVEIGDNSAKTNDDGEVRFSKLKLGTQSLTIKQPGFQTINETVTLGFGSNPLGDYKLRAVGAQFRFKLVDYLSGKPVNEAQIEVGDSNAQSDKEGKLILTLDDSHADKLEAKLTASGYRTEELELVSGQKQSVTIQLVPASPIVYISRASGKYDLYKVDIDGKNRKQLLPASGFEDGEITVVVQDGGKQAAVISKRDDLKNQDGYRLQALTIVNLDKGSTLTLDHSEKIQIVDWVGNKLIYVKIKAGTSAGNDQRYQLMSYDYDTTSRLLVASANYFGGVISAQGQLYYATSNNYQGGVSLFARINTDTTGKKVIADKTDIWSLNRTSYDGMSYTTNDGKFSYKIGDSAGKKVGDNSSTDPEVFYLDASDNKRAIWVDNRDGKGVLLLHDTNGKDKALVTQKGLTYPLRWLNNRTVVYRVSIPGETAEYAISLDGGSAKKITDVTATSGFGPFGYH